jgi:hypothetical protein
MQHKDCHLAKGQVEGFLMLNGEYRFAAVEKMAVQLLRNGVAYGN